MIDALATNASKAEISESLDGIQERLDLGEIYDGMRELRCRLHALTAFYESHYVCFCFSQARDARLSSPTRAAPHSVRVHPPTRLLSVAQDAGQWIHYDDDTRKVVGVDFDKVKEKCIMGRLHPQLLFYCSDAEPAGSKP